MKLVYHPNEWLDKQVAPFDFEKLDAKQIEKDMIKIMEDNQGVGLSANQVGLDAQIFVMKPEGKDAFAVINPKVEAVSEQIIEGEEGCLSFPGLYVKVKRAAALVASYVDSSNKECKIEFKGWEARIFQHEFDHLNGINYIDRVSKLRLDMAKKKQQKLMKLISQKVKDSKLYG